MGNLLIYSAADNFSIWQRARPCCYDKLNFNFIRDIAPVASILRQPNVMVAHRSFPAKTIPEFIALAKAHPAEINMASPGIALRNI